MTVTAEKELIQTETGAREGLITAAQIENLSIISRSPMELLRILPGVVTPDQSQLESVSQGGGANNTDGYNVNGVRGSNNVNHAGRRPHDRRRARTTASSSRPTPTSSPR